MSRRIASAAAAAAVAAVLSTGCGGTVGATASAANVIPASAVAYFAINTDTGSPQWRTLAALSRRFPDRDSALKTFHQTVHGQGLTWERDVKPALGPEVDFVWLDFDRDGGDFVVLVQPDDDKKFERLLDKESGFADLVHARVGDWQVLAPRQELLDRFRAGGDALADRKPFQQAMKGYPDDFLVRAYVDGGAVMRVARRDGDPKSRKLLPKLGTLDWFASNLGVTSDGIRWDANIHGTPGPALSGISPTHPFTPTLSRVVPQDALAYFAFHGARGMLSGLEHNALLHDVPQLHRYAGVLRQVESLLQGENALWVRPAAGKLPEVTFVAEPAAGTDGAATLDRLLARYRTQLQLPSLPTPTTVAGVRARVFADGPFHVYYANVGKRLVLTSRPAGIAALEGTPASLADSADYQATLRSAGMPAKTQGFVYVNLKGGLGYAQRLSKLSLPGAVRRDLGPLKSALEYGATRPSELQVTFFLRIG